MQQLLRVSMINILNTTSLLIINLLIFLDASTGAISWMEAVRRYFHDYMPTSDSIALPTTASLTSVANLISSNLLFCVLPADGDDSGGARAFRPALHVANMEEMVRMQFQLGCAFQEQDKVAEAILCYRCALALDPDIADFHYNLGTPSCPCPASPHLAPTRPCPASSRLPRPAD